MGDLTLAKLFNMLSDENWHYAILMMRDFMWLLGPFSPIPWLARLGFGIPGVARGWKRWLLWCEERMTERIEVRETCDGKGYFPFQEAVLILLFVAYIQIEPEKPDVSLLGLPHKCLR